jgi:predicted Ser/Thr protein kinase
VNEFQTITVKRSGKSTHINNPTEYKLIGKGRQGAVFKLSENRCVKIYVEEKYCRREKRALMSAQDFNIVPKVYEVGSNYIVMEYIEGLSLSELIRRGVDHDNVVPGTSAHLRDPRPHQATTDNTDPIETHGPTLYQSGQ